MIPFSVHTSLLFFGETTPQWVRTFSFTRFLDHTQRRTTVGRTPLEEWSARRRDLYLTTNNTHHRQTSMPPMGFEPTISASKRPQTYALDRAATGIGIHTSLTLILLTWRIWWAPNNASRWQMGFNTVFNLLKSTCYVIHHQFNIQQLYFFPTLYLCVLYLSENKQRLVSLTA